MPIEAECKRACIIVGSVLRSINRQSIQKLDDLHAVALFLSIIYDLARKRPPEPKRLLSEVAVSSVMHRNIYDNLQASSYTIQKFPTGNLKHI